MPGCERRSGSRPCCANKVSSTTGVSAVGPICATPLVPTISCAIEEAMGNFFAELKRRHIYRVAAAYAVVAWLLLQVVNNLAPIFDLPPWIARAMVLLLVIGFPLALVLAWLIELKAPLPDTAKPEHVAVDWILACALVAVIALISYEQIGARNPTAQQQASLAPSAAPGALAPQAGISIAVLPFTNLSGDATQEFFSDGMTEE